MLVAKQLLAAIDFHSMEKKILWKSLGTKNYLVANILQNIFFCVLIWGLEQIKGL